MKSMPPPLSANQFACLSIEEPNTTPVDTLTPTIVSTPLDVSENPPASPTPSAGSPRPRIPAWQRHLPRRYVVASTPLANSLRLKVEVETTDTQQIQSVVALLDSGATGLFVDADYVARHQLTTRPLLSPIPVYNIDGTPNEAGSICAVVDLVLRYWAHAERATFAVTSLGKQDMILGYTWLWEHNPEIDWERGSLQLSQCPSTCPATKSSQTPAATETHDTEVRLTAR